MPRRRDDIQHVTASSIWKPSGRARCFDTEPAARRYMSLFNLSYSPSPPLPSAPPPLFFPVPPLSLSPCLPRSLSFCLVRASRVPFEAPPLWRAGPVILSGRRSAVPCPVEVPLGFKLRHLGSPAESGPPARCCCQLSFLSHGQEPAEPTVRRESQSIKECSHDQSIACPVPPDQWGFCRELHRSQNEHSAYSRI